jgi:hypothetical protein
MKLIARQDKKEDTEAKKEDTEMADADKQPEVENVD